MNSFQWLLIDTETSGLRNPVYCVEIAAQLMNGLEPDGPAFHVLLNHDVDIDPAAEALHGYSRQFLRQNGANPIEAHQLFRSYAGERPVVSFNLSFDWGRILEPEFVRLGVPPAGCPGFCALTLARRCLYEADSHRLEVLSSMFLPDAPPLRHRAPSDVEVTLRLFREVMWPRLQRAGLSQFSEIAEFSRTTPVASCVERICGPGASTHHKVDRLTPLASTDAISELVGLIHGILADNKVVGAEFWALRHWLDAHPDCRVEGAENLRRLVTAAIADGVVTAKELRNLRDSLAELAR